MESKSQSSEALFHRNVAVVEFDTEDRRRDLLSTTGLESYVIRELTPTAVLMDPNKAQRVIERLRELGLSPNVQEAD